MKSFLLSLTVLPFLIFGVSSAAADSQPLTLVKWKSLSRAEKLEALNDDGVMERSVSFADLKNEAMVAKIKAQAAVALGELGDR